MLTLLKEEPVDRQEVRTYSRCTSRWLRQQWVFWSQLHWMWLLLNANSSSSNCWQAKSNRCTQPQAYFGTLSQHAHQSCAHGKRIHVFYWQNRKWLEPVADWIYFFKPFHLSFSLSLSLLGWTPESLEPIWCLFLWYVWCFFLWAQGRLRLLHKLRGKARDRVKSRTVPLPLGDRWYSGKTTDRCSAWWTVELSTFLPGLEAKKELPGSFCQIPVLHADAREAISVGRLHQGVPPKLFVARQGILSVLDKCLITGGKPQAAQEPASSTVPRAVSVVHRRRLFPRLHITYHPTHNTHFPNSLPSSLLKVVFQTPRSETTSHLSNLSQAPDTAEEHLGLDKGLLQLDLEEVWAQCSLVLHLNSPKTVTIITSRMATDPIQWYPQVPPSHLLQMVWITDTPTAFSMRNLPLPTQSLMPTKRFLLWWIDQELLGNQQSEAHNMSSFLPLEDLSLLSRSLFLKAEPLQTLP